MNYLYHNIALRIVIADNLSFDVCETIAIEQSVQVLTNTAKITLPRELRNALDSSGKRVDISGKSILNFMQRGDRVLIFLGYDGDLAKEFSGYITKIGAETPLVIECQDEMYQLKKMPRISLSLQNADLETTLKEILPSYDIVLSENYKIGTWVIDNATPFEVLEQLKNKLGIRAFFDQSKRLMVGMMIDFSPSNAVVYNFSENLREGTNLSFETREDKPLEVVAKSKQTNGEELVYTTGEKGGDTLNIRLPEISIEDLKKWAEKTHQSRSFTGFTGSLEAWGYPRTQAGDKLQIVRPFYKDKHQDGEYFAESVSINVSETTGFKRTIKISHKL
ncbi:MAG: hypothetical protein RQ756_02540 [Flavobacteriaceae bacterium]|nr:hypothetical protein [Flavobacteriaceae bacterium]